jgi:RNA polymerase sigma factor (sigma-70 family)
MIRARDPLADPEPLIRRVYAYVAYRIGDGPDAEDVTSEVFERALRYRDSYDSSRGEPMAWLVGIARRCLVDRPRSGPLPVTELLEVAEPAELEDRTVARLTLARAVAQLRPFDRELIALRYGSDLTARQIGEIVDARTNAVEVSLHRALARLRNLLEVDSQPQEAHRP